ncbi:hypothetical protein [Sphingomonas nostoxanthinifaciens]|uniref:hypothetical protein n=1 Tax=Sphingomonas nostoxanthinifaciens TaxID=2872652 RepID=UPI001CC1F126|nr:hypothetical protein [Sphingomonas nostoxanthinifaciens]UAK22896.1 hypothetical protein K8P63_10645 [Sphingomonas nostoxanthinifaciens]
MIGALLLAGLAAAATPAAIEGNWVARDYTPKSGVAFPLRGAMMVQGDMWSLTYLVMVDGKAQRAFAETGRFTRQGDTLALGGNVAIYSYAPAVPGLWEQPERMIAFPEDGGKPVTAAVKVSGDVLTITYGSGSVMTFLRR